MMFGTDNFLPISVPKGALPFQHPKCRQKHFLPETNLSIKIISSLKKLNFMKSIFTLIWNFASHVFEHLKREIHESEPSRPFLHVSDIDGRSDSKKLLSILKDDPHDLIQHGFCRGSATGTRVALEGNGQLVSDVGKICHD